MELINTTFSNNKPSEGNCSGKADCFKTGKGLSVPDAAMLIKLAEVLDVPVSKLLGSETETEEKSDTLAEQLSSINEQLAKKADAQKWHGK